MEPGPAIAKHAASCPVSLPYALAANAAAPSWRMPMNVRSPRTSAARIASAKPRFEWPTMPNTCVTPHAIIVSTMRSEIVRARGVLGRQRDVDAVGAHLDRMAARARR